MTAIGVLNRQQSAASSTNDPSRAAIIGIALGGSIVLFLALSHVFILLGRRRDRERLASLQAIRDLTQTPHGTPFDPYDSDTGPFKNKLRKRSLRRSDLKAVLLDGETDVNARGRSSSVPVLPPLFSRRESYDISLLPHGTPDDTPETIEHTEEALREWEASQQLELQKGRQMYQSRRKSSWIDEDALHGPKVSPQKAEAASADRPTSSPWFSSYLGKKMSFRRPRSEPFIFGHPTLPLTEQAAELGLDEERGRSAKRMSMSAVHDEVMLPPRPLFQNSPYKPGQYNVSGVTIPNAFTITTSPLPNPPSAKINNPRHRDSVALQATEKLAGSARVPVIVQQQQQHQQRPQHPKHRATESELTEILRMTSERLQDGKRSSRRQTMMPRSRHAEGGGSSGDIYYEQYMDMMRANSGSRNSSPAKSQRSAPAIMCAELEDTEISPTKSQCSVVDFATAQLPKHDRQDSQISATSETDSLLVSQGVPQSEHIATALSSPSRSVHKADTPRREEAPHGQPQRYSPASSHSSALSTLYSEEEDREITAVDFRGILRADSDEQQNYNSGSTGFRFTDGESPRRGLQQHRRRGTVGQIAFPWPQPAARIVTTLERPEASKAWQPHETSQQFAIYTMEEQSHDDPFVTLERNSTQDPVRLSQVFTPVPVSPGLVDHVDGSIGVTATNDTYPTVRVTRPISTPTASPKNNNRIMPPPHLLRPLTDSPTLGTLRRGTSPAPSHGGSSSVYDSYCGSDIGPSMNPSTATLDTVPTNESRTKPTQSGSNQNVQGQTVTTNKLPRRQGSTESVYSQNDGGDGEADTVPPLRSTITHLHITGTEGALADAVAELRRMNSAVSAASGSSSVASAGSPTLPAMRGGGFGPGKKTGGSRNYLALGSPERVVSPKRQSGNPRDLVAGVGSGGNRELLAPASGALGGNRMKPPRSRRGTMMSSSSVILRGLEGSEDLTKGVLKEGSGGNMGTAVGGPRELKTKREAGLQVSTRASEKASIESLGLYDEKGFLRSSPARRS